VTDVTEPRQPRRSSKVSREPSPLPSWRRSNEGEPIPSSTAIRVWYLRRLDLLQELTEHDLEALAKMTVDREYPRGALLLEAIDAPSVFLLKHGTVELFRSTPDGREVTTALLRGGALFGAGGLLAVGRRGLSARVVEDALVCQSSARKFLSFARDHPSMMLGVVRELAAQLFRAEETIEMLATRDVASRVAAAILSQANTGGTDGVTPPLTREAWASLCGTTRESVSRTLSRFKAREWIRESGRSIAILDQHALHTVAAGAKLVVNPPPGAVRRNPPN